MEIQELVTKRRELEKKLTRLTSDAVEEFKSETGISPSGIYINTVKVQVFGSQSLEHVVSKCSVDLDLR